MILSRSKSVICMPMAIWLCWLPIDLIAQKPNILFIIADDLGVDVSNGYHQNSLMPTTPTLDSLRKEGITFENVWATPVCTPTRAGIMSGKYGNKTGVLKAPGNLDTTHTSIFKELAARTNNAYSDAVIGKWHISQPTDPNHPSDHGVDYYMGILGAQWNAYDDWDKTQFGQTTKSTEYVSSAFTNEAIYWINKQNQPWFLWLAHVAPHTPIHLPPDSMYSIKGTGTNYRKYLAMIESFDYEVNRLLKSMPDSVRKNTLIIYIGDNGTPNNFLQNYPSQHGKGSLYQGGIHVPMIVSGAGVSRKGVREDALVNVIDIYATVLEVAGADLDGGIYNSLSFKHLLNGTSGANRTYNYSEITDSDIDAITIRNNRYKLIAYFDGTQAFFDLETDSLEFKNLLLTTLSTEQKAIKLELEAEANQIVNAWSCKDHIRNGDEEEIDCGGSYCAPCNPNILPEVATAGFSIYPNPASSQFTIERTNRNLATDLIFQITDPLGRSLGQYILHAQSHSLQIDISKVENQLLILQVIDPYNIDKYKSIKLIIGN